MDRKPRFEIIFRIDEMSSGKEIKRQLIRAMKEVGFQAFQNSTSRPSPLEIFLFLKKLANRQMRDY